MHSGVTTPVPGSIGKYRVEGIIGRGAMGIVYKGFDTALERPVAIKTIRAELLDDDDRRTWMVRFQQEARAVCRCQHSNIVTVFDFGTEGETPFLVMEYVNGQELRQTLRGGVRLRISTILFIANQVLLALDSAHGNGVIHRDVKPANVIILHNGMVKLTDFGVARIDTSDLTATGMMLGTPSYMAPEQFRGEPATPLLDVFAVGALLFEMLAGKPPFAGKTSSEVMYRIINEEPDFVTSDRPVPPLLQAAIGKALAKDPRQRFPSAIEFADALQRVAQVLAASGANGNGPPGSDIDAALATRVGAFSGRPSWGETAPAGQAPPAAEPLPRRQPVQQPVRQPVQQPVQQPAPQPAGDPALTGGVTSTGSASSVEPAKLAQLEQALTLHLGPIAKIIVRKQLAALPPGPGALRELARRLADHIPNEKERGDFLNSVF